MSSAYRFALLSLALLPACKEDSEPAPETTYWQHVAPIFYESCVGCHREGGSAPFRLDTPADAAKWADLSAAAVAERTMPPWLMSADGTCGEFKHTRALTDAQIDTIAAWAEAGAPAGDVRDDLVAAAPPRLTEGLDLKTPEFVPVADGGPLSTFDEYRCFAVDPGLAVDKFLTGYDVTPGNTALVHHVLAMPVDPATPSYLDPALSNGDVMEMLDAQSPDRAGWPCYSAAGDGVSVDQIPITWAPGMGAVEYPDGTGVRLRAGELVVIQVHYNLHFDTADGASDSSQVRLRLADSVEREGYFMLLDLFIDTLFDGGDPDSLAPGQQSAKYTWDAPLAEWLLPQFGVDQLELHGIFPHMHERGRTWRAELTDPAGDTCIGDVPRWDFAWQLYYFYEQPLVLRPGSGLRVTCDYDTRDAAAPVTPGWGTQNEMCLAGLFVVP